MAIDTMTSRFGHDVLAVFDVWEETRDFLADVIEQRCTSEHDFKMLFDQSLMGGDENFQYMIDRATSIMQRHAQSCPLTENDILTSMWCMLDRIDLQPMEKPWRETDCLIERAKTKAADSERLLWSLRLPHLPQITSPEIKRPKAKRKPSLATSHYWADEIEAPQQEKLAARSTSHPRSNLVSEIRTAASSSLCGTSCLAVERSRSKTYLPSPAKRTKQSGTSPYFAEAPIEDAKRKRPPAGTISCIPFPPLTADSFGIIQEKVAQEPFWLLIAITFLIKTSGQLAIPAFLRIKQRFPTHKEVADLANKEEILQMIQHLGLGHNRLRFMQKYARAFLESPPQANVLYKVRNYASREITLPGDQPEIPTTDQNSDSWEIGHMTQGKYAIDSWRIFCRDRLLGRAEDWNGKGREPEFQPEWMRVLPADKELRAYLRWMWMKEWWEWDPGTGERTVLREEMQRAVNEGRVEYDDDGGLRMIDPVVVRIQ